MLQAVAKAERQSKNYSLYYLQGAQVKFLLTLCYSKRIAFIVANLAVGLRKLNHQWKPGKC